MLDPILYPIHEERSVLERHSKMALHTGRGHFGPIGEAHELNASVVVPACGGCIITLSGDRPHLPAVGPMADLHIDGDSEDGPFKLVCAEVSVTSNSELREEPGWAIAAPMNGPMTIAYGHDRAIASVRAEINNFDFEFGNVPDTEKARSRRMEHSRLRVNAANHEVEFVARPERIQMRRLAHAGVIPTACFTFFSFAAWPGALKSHLVQFAYDVASLCTYVAQQHTAVPVLALLDANDRVVQRVVRNPVESIFRRDDIFGGQVPDGITHLFRQCFAEHVKMQRSALPWSRLPSHLASIDDPPYLEQKFASLMMAIEFFMKNSLMELQPQRPSTDVEAMQLPKLIGCCRSLLRWDIPKHYTAGDLIRLLRNAVMHGGELPTKDSAEFRHAYDKWRLFLTRRVLMRLGYDGKLYSPHSGWASSSPVGDFSEDHNTFG